MFTLRGGGLKNPFLKIPCCESAVERRDQFLFTECIFDILIIECLLLYSIRFAVNTFRFERTFNAIVPRLIN